MYSEFFEKMRKRYNSYREKHKEWVDTKMRMLNGADEKKRKAFEEWCDQNPPPRNPCSDGELAAMLLYEYAVSIGSDTLILNGTIESHAVPLFVRALKQAGFKEFVLTHSDVNTLDRLDDFCLEGCKLGELVQILTVKPEPGKKGFAHTGLEIIL